MELRITTLLLRVVSRSQTQTDAQGLIACSISARAVRVWATDTAKFVLAATRNWVGVDWLKGVRHLYRSPLKGFHPWKCCTSLKFRAMSKGHLRVPRFFQPIDTHPISCGSQNKLCCVSCPDPNRAGAYTASDKALRVSLGLATRD